MEDRNYTGDDTREFGPEHDICINCGACRCDDCRDCACREATSEELSAAFAALVRTGGAK
jgi:hypothetical protein